MSQIATYQQFPVCVKEAASADEVGAGTEYPLGFTLDEAFLVLWRLKKMSVHIDAQISFTAVGNVPPEEDFFGHGGPFEDHLNISGTGDTAFYSSLISDWRSGSSGEIIDDEKSLVCPRRFMSTPSVKPFDYFFSHFAMGGGESDEINDNDFAIHVVIRLNLTAPVMKWQDKYHPHLFIEVASGFIRLQSLKSGGFLYESFDTKFHFSGQDNKVALYNKELPTYPPWTQVTQSASLLLTLGGGEEWAFAP